MDIKFLITIFLLFTLVAGIIIIYQEEIMKMEFLARLQTTPIPQTEQPVTSALPKPYAPPVPRPDVQTFFYDNRDLTFGEGQITDVRAKGIKKIEPGKILHVITSGVSNYYARGFLEEAERLYEPSPHAGSIVFHNRTSGIKESEPEREYFVLLVSSALPEPIDITGWKVFDKNKKISYSLPKGIKVLGTGGIQKAVPIRVGAGNTVIISSGRSPVGSSFRINKCSGYRSQFKNFTPTIKTQCPKPLDEFISFGSVPYTDNKCFDIVNRMGTCTTVTDIPTGISDKCHELLENVITESGCVGIHRNDSDFFSSEWRLFLGSQRGLWRNEDNVLYLLDKERRLVTTLVYS